MTSTEIRSSFLEFFASKGHAIVPSAPPQASVEFYSHLSENTPEAPAGLYKIASIIFSAPSKENVVYARSADSPEVLQVDPAVFILISPSN